MILNFGKHSGQRVEDLPDDYVTWALENLDERRHGALLKELREQVDLRAGKGVVRKAAAPLRAPGEIATITARAIAAALEQVRCPFADEFQVHDVLQGLLAKLDVLATREHRLPGVAGRLDFFVPSVGLAIEVKVQGNPTEVLRQLLRYAQCDEVQALLLVTARHRLAQAVTPTLLGKPVVIASLWKGGL